MVVETTVIRYGVDLSLSVPTPAKQLQPLGPLGEQIVDRVRYQTERRHTTSPAELAATLGIDRTTASRYLSRLAAAGRVRRVARAEYAAIDPEEL